jgi:hypothetical protein
MTTPHRSLIKQLERIDNELAALRDQHGRISARIATLETTRKTGLLKIASEIVSGLDLSQVPVSRLIDRLATLNEVHHDDDDSVTTEEDVNRQRDDSIKTFVKLSRNTTAEKRALLEGSGLHWNGRAAGWSGSVGSAELARLHLVFKNRVTPPMTDAGESPAFSQESDAEPLCADEAQDAAQGEPDALETRTDKSEPVEQTVVMPTMTTLFRGLPLRRPPANLREPENPA